MTSVAVTDLHLADIPAGEARVTVVEGAEVAVFHTRSGQLYALDAQCPHMGGPLADGLCDEKQVLCPLHGRSFALADGGEAGGELKAQTWLAGVDGDGRITVSAP